MPPYLAASSCPSVLEASWGARVSTPPVSPKAERFRSLAEAASDGLARIQELEAAKARVESQLLEAYAWLRTVQEQQCGAVLARRGHGSVVPVSVDQVVAKEMALATGLSEAQVSRRLHLVTRPRRHRLLRDELAAGRTSLARALAVAEATVALPDDAVSKVEASVLAPARDGGQVSAATFRQRLRRRVLAADPRGADERRASARVSRTAYGRLTEEGMGVLTLVASAERVVGILDRADAAARAVRARGDPRTLDQLRSDFIGDTLLFGRTGTGPTSPDVTPGVTSGGTAGWPAMPGAKVWIVVPFEVAAGRSEAPCELPGHGWVTAAHARELMTAPGSEWRRLAVDVDSGRALELSTQSYTPHHRRCHNRKTSGVFRSRPVADGGLAWTTLAGREYVTYPKDWREALRGGPGRAPGPPDDPPPF